MDTLFRVAERIFELYSLPSNSMENFHWKSTQLTPKTNQRLLESDQLRKLNFKFFCSK